MAKRWTCRPSSTFRRFCDALEAFGLLPLAFCQRQRPEAKGAVKYTGSVSQWQQREQAKALLAKEVGYVRKPHAGRLRVALAFPNTYFVGMSNLGFQTVYRLFNAEAQDLSSHFDVPAFLRRT